MGVKQNKKIINEKKKQSHNPIFNVVQQDCLHLWTKIVKKLQLNRKIKRLQNAQK